jgi:hypothetical protein
MSRFAIEDAVRRGNKARVAVAGPAGGGKTFTALTIATELAGDGETLVIDTERGSASLYADLFKFKTIRWEPPYDPRELSQEVTNAASQFAVVVIDSMTHFWKGEGGTLAIVDAAAQRASGNKYVGWNTGTTAQDIDHRLMVSKSRCSSLAGAVFAPGEAVKMARVLLAWLEGNAPDDVPSGDGEAVFHRLGWSSRLAHDEWHAAARQTAKSLGEPAKEWCDANGLSFARPVARDLAQAFDQFAALSAPFSEGAA